MLKIIDYAILSSHIYNVSQGNKYGIDIKPIKNGGSIPNGWTIVTDVDPYVQPANHFFAAMYLKFSNGRPTDAVTAFRGTMSNDINNLLEDYNTWFSDAADNGKPDEMPTYFPQAQGFAYQCRTYLIEHFAAKVGPMNLCYTGHSLGGALAKLVTLDSFPGKAIAFNAPGCGHLPHIMAELTKDYVTDFIFNINARYGIINKIGETMGNLFFIDVPNDEPAAKIVLEKLLAEQAKDEKKKLTENSTERTARTLDEYANAASVLKTTPEYREAYVTCERELDKQHWSLTRSLKSCHATAEMQAFGDVIIAQHSIENMIHALT